MRPDAHVVVGQLLLAYANVGSMRVLLRMWLGQGGYAMLRAAGLPSGRARAVNLMAAWTARGWRSDGVAVTAKLVKAEADRLLV